MNSWNQFKITAIWPLVSRRGTSYLGLIDYEESYFIENYFCSGTIEDTELIDGLVFNQKGGGQGGPNKVEKAKIGLIQFCISPPKTDVSHQNSLVIKRCVYIIS